MSWMLSMQSTQVNLIHFYFFSFLMRKFRFGLIKKKKKASMPIKWQSSWMRPILLWFEWIWNTEATFFFFLMLLLQDEEIKLYISKQQINYICSSSRFQSLVHHLCLISQTLIPWFDNRENDRRFGGCFECAKYKQDVKHSAVGIKLKWDPAVSCVFL